MNQKPLIRTISAGRLMMLQMLTAADLKAGEPKTEKQEFCAVHGIYTKHTDYTGVTIHVCAFLSEKSICYYVACNELQQVKKIQTSLPERIPLEEGKKAIIIPRDGGYEVIYYNELEYSQDSQSVSIITK